MRTELIEKKLADMIDAVNLVSDNLPSSFKEFSSLGLIKDGLYKKLEYAIESVLDIFSIINADLDLGIPESEEDILDNLEKKKIFSKKFVEIIRHMKSFRNVLVHKYGDINDKQAYKDIKDGLSDFEIVEKEVNKFLVKYRK